jgi:hypothetical protein
MAQLSEDGEIFDSKNDNDDNLLSVKQILTFLKRVKRVINLTDDDKKGDDSNFTEIS